MSEKELYVRKISDDVEIEAASWADVYRNCCCRSGAGWLKIGGFAGAITFFLYFFLMALELLGNAAKVMGGCAAGSLLGDIQNPIAGLMIGILSTVLLQSSSTTTSIVVGLVPDAIDVRLGIYVIMGANIGTSVTSTIVAIGQMGDADQLERAFAGATVHDMFNFLAVAVLLPLEIVTGYLYHLTKAMVPDSVEKGEKWEGPLKKLVSPVAKLILIANKDVTKAVAKGTQTCADFYPEVCLSF
jgi:sodium-dependent phosphate cotransporter